MTTSAATTTNSIVEGRILVVDTDLHISEMVKSHFGHDGFMVDSCTVASDFYAIDLTSYNLLIIDIDLDDQMGLNIVEQIKQRPETANIGVITCAINMSPTTIINALNSGADDYLIKPFSMRELTARVRAVLRHKI